MWLLPKLLHAVAREANAYLDFEYFTGDLHEFSNIYTYERYARVNRSLAQKAIDRDGIFMRIWNLFADIEDTKAEFSMDNTEIVGYNHQLPLNQAAASELFPGGRRGFRAKHYHPKHVRTDGGKTGGPSDPLYHRRLRPLS